MIPEYPQSEPETSASGYRHAREQDGGGVAFDPREYVLALALKKWWILGAAVLGGIAALVVYLFNPPTYTARTTLEVFGRNENFLNLNQVDPEAGSGLYSANASNLQTQIQILMSNQLRIKVLERLRLDPLPTPAPSTGVLAKLRERLGVVPADPEDRTRQALAIAVKSYRPGVVRETRIIEILCRSTNPDIAALFLNALVSEYIDQTLASRSYTSTRTSQWISEQLNEAKSKIDRNEKALKDFERSTGYTAPTPQETLPGATARQLREELSRAHAERLDKQAKWESLSKAPRESLAALADDATLRSAETSYLELRKQMADLKQTYTASHPSVRKVEAQVAEVRQEIERDRQLILDTAKAGYETAVRRERLLNEAYSRQNYRVAAESDNAADRQLRQREVDVAQQTYNMLLQQANQAAMAAATPAEYVRVIDRAAPGALPEGLKPFPTVALGLLGGLLLGSAGVVVRHEMRQTLRQSLDSSKIFQAPSIAVIPALPAPRRPMIGAPRGRQILDLNNGAAHAVETWTGDSTHYVESFRWAIASIIGTREDARKQRALVISSPGPNEGKSSVTLNLGIALAETGRKVLLIDMDLRRPQLHRRLARENSPGISEVNLDEVPLDASTLESFIQPVSHANLTLVAAGNISPARIPAFLHHRRLSVLLAQLRGQADFVLIDTPPLGAFADARTVARLCDGVLMVLRSGQTTKREAVEARTQLEADGTPLIGTILNDARTEHHERYYKYYQAGSNPSQ